MAQVMTIPTSYKAFRKAEKSRSISSSVVYKCGAIRIDSPHISLFCGKRKEAKIKNLLYKQASGVYSVEKCQAMGALS
jgi:hypothetical protein